MLAQHVLPMRRTLGTDGVAHMATSPINGASPTSKQLVRNTSPGIRNDASKTLEPAKRGRRLRTESWTISEDKALHAATAVADAVLISDHETASEGVDTNEYVTPEDTQQDLDLDGEEELEEDKEKSKSLSSEVKEKEDTEEQKVVEPEPEHEMKTEASNPVVSSESAKPDVTPSGKIVEPLSESESVDGLEKRVCSLSRSSPKSDIESTAVETEGTSKSVLREPSMTSTDTESTTSRKLDESARESFDTSCDSLRLVLEDDDQDDLNESSSRVGEIDEDKDAESEGSKPAGIPLSDSMPELSKICEQPADANGEANLTVPELTPVKDLAGKPLVSEPGASKRMEFRSQRARALETDDSSQDDVQDENVDIEGGDEEGDMEVQAVNSQLMAHLAKNAPIDNNVVVLATWSVHSEEEVTEDDVGELDVTGATADSAEDGVVQVDADKLKKAMRENDKRSETTDDKTHDADETTDEMKDVSLTTFKNKLDDILGHYVAADEIEEVVVSDVREQIDDIVTAVELNESRDEELSRSFEGSPEKEDPDKSTEDEAEHENDGEDAREKPEKQEDKFEEYPPEGSKGNEDNKDKVKNRQEKSDNKDSGMGTSESEKERESGTTGTTTKSSKKSERQPSEDSDRYVFYRLNVLSLEAGHLNLKVTYCSVQREKQMKSSAPLIYVQWTQYFSVTNIYK